jgi:hypothetical protein
MDRSPPLPWLSAPDPPALAQTALSLVSNACMTVDRAEMAVPESAPVTAPPPAKRSIRIAWPEAV